MDLTGAERTKAAKKEASAWSAVGLCVLAKSRCSRSLQAVRAKQELRERSKILKKDAAGAVNLLSGNDSTEDADT